MLQARQADLVDHYRPGRAVTSSSARPRAFATLSRRWSGIFQDFPFVNTLTLRRLNPLPIGQHVVEVSWVFSAMHCDGIAANVSENSFPAGETLYARTAFEVTPGHH